MSIYEDPFAEALGIEPIKNLQYIKLKDLINPSEIIETYISAWKGNHHTEESKSQIGDSNRGRKRTPEAKEKMRLAKLGKKRGPHSEEHKKKLSESVRNSVPFTEERRKKISLSKLGKKNPKVSLANKGRIPWNKGMRKNEKAD